MARKGRKPKSQAQKLKDALERTIFHWGECFAPRFRPSDGTNLRCCRLSASIAFAGG